MKERILSTTAKLIAKQGMAAASTRAICAELGITAPTLYHYFRDKSALLESVTALAFEQHLEKINVRPKEAAALEDLRQCWNAYMDFVAAEPELYAIMLDAIAKGKIPQSGALCLKDLGEKFAAPELAPRLRYSAQKSAHIYLATAQGIATLALANATTASSRHEEAREVILSALLKDGAPSYSKS